MHGPTTHDLTGGNSLHVEAEPCSPDPGCRLLAAGSPAFAEAPDFNGTWSVQLVTETGVCGGSSSYTVAIQDGQVRLASAGGSTSVTGRIGADGSVGLSVEQGPGERAD